MNFVFYALQGCYFRSL